MIKLNLKWKLNDEDKIRVFNILFVMSYEVCVFCYIDILLDFYLNLGGFLVWLRSIWFVFGSIFVGLEGGYEMFSFVNENWIYWVVLFFFFDWGLRFLVRVVGEGDRGYFWKWEFFVDRIIFYRSGDNIRYRFFERKKFLLYIY